MTFPSHSVSAAADWLDELRQTGAATDAERVLHFDDPAAELAALSAAPTVHPLPDWSILRASGRDAGAFLQSQLSNDIGMLDASRAQLSTYCTAQGRMLATLLLWRHGDDYYLRLPGDIAPGVAAKLRRYVLRAAVALEDCPLQLRLLGLGGPGASAALAGLVDIPEGAMAMSSSPEGTVIRLHEQELFEIAVPVRHWSKVWNHLASFARPAGADAWTWRLIDAGLPVITAATQEQFVPQMANLEQLGAVSFDKGCYPGQEIVARAQYRGEVKRRLFRLHADDTRPAAGQPIFEPARDTPCGTVVQAAAAPGGGFDLLAVVATSAADAGQLHLGGPDGAAVHVCR
jgi:tRNA-modifying protein YgfZ